MEDFEEIKNAVGDLDLDPNTNQDANPSSERITVMSTDPITTLQANVARLTIENAEIKAELAALKSRVAPLIVNSIGKKKRTRPNLEGSNLFRMERTDTSPNLTKSPERDEDADSIVDVSKPASMSSSLTGTTTEFINPFAGQSASTSFDGNENATFLKSNSAIANTGYVNKKQLWGTAFACFLIGASRHCIAKTGASNLKITEKEVVTNCIRIADTLHKIALHKGLPDVKDPSTLSLAKVMSRRAKDDIHVMDASSWWGISKYQDGKDIMFTIQTLVDMAQKVPEAITNPISHIIPYLRKPLIQTRPEPNPVNGQVEETPFFAMSKPNMDDMYPNGWERWCSILKEPALTKYIRYRVVGNGMTEPQVVSKMVMEMRSSDLVEQKNMDLLGQLAPFTQRSEPTT